MGLRRKFEGFCFRNRDKGIHNLMLYLVIGSAIVYLFTEFTQDTLLYDILCFDRELILQGQVWRLFSYAITFNAGGILFEVIGLICFFSLGRAMENAWGSLKFTLYYLVGIVLMDVFAMLIGGYADIYYLDLSLFLGYATLYPNAVFLILFVIPVKSWLLALCELVLVLGGMLGVPFPYCLFPLVSIANYFLFFGKDVKNIIPLSWQANVSRLFRKKSKKKTGTVPLAGSYQAEAARAKAPYTHRCTVCGRTDVSDPDLEFRYCSRCNGYFCYCQDHIDNHSHIE